MTITGRITRDAVVNTLENEKQVVNFSIATNDYYRNNIGERIQQTTFFECSYWLSPKVAKILTKGAVVELSGRLSARAWKAKDGSLKVGLSLHTSNIKIHTFTVQSIQTEQHHSPDMEKGNKNHDNTPF